MFSHISPLDVPDQGPLLGYAGIGKDNVKVANAMSSTELSDSLDGALLAAGVISDCDKLAAGSSSQAFQCLSSGVTWVTHSGDHDLEAQSHCQPGLRHGELKERGAFLHGRPAPGSA